MTPIIYFASSRLTCLHCFFFVSLRNLSPFSLLFEKVTCAQTNKYQQSYPWCITVFLSISFYYTYYYYYYYYYYYLNSYLIIFVIFFNVCIYESVYIDEWQPQNGNSVFPCYYRVIFYLCTDGGKKSLNLNLNLSIELTKQT